MRFDAHCHAWGRWPYDRNPPSPNYGDGQSLLDVLDAHGVSDALIVGARLGRTTDPEANRDNNDYIAQLSRSSGGRLHWVADVDSRWDGAGHHRGDSSARARSALEAGAAGVSHYCAEAPDDWFSSLHGQEFLDQLAGAVLSIHLPRAWIGAFEVALRGRTDVRVLVHHVGHVPNGDDQGLERLLQLMANPSVALKLSGFGYLVDDPQHEDPLSRESTVVRAVWERYGADRLVWGSDFPVSMQHYSYQDAINAVERCCPFLSGDELELVFGGNMNRLLGLRR